MIIFFYKIPFFKVHICLIILLLLLFSQSLSFCELKECFTPINLSKKKEVRISEYLNVME